MIGHTQPRRIAARTVSERVAEELGVDVGQQVGWSVRFTDRAGPNTLVRVMTDGILLAEIQRDRMLSRYDTLIIDEAHERSLNVDFLLGYLKQLLPRRPDLKVVITSATIDPQRFSRHFDDAPVIEVSGRTYPVELRYRPVVDPDDPDADPDRDQVQAICDAVVELHGRGRRRHPGVPVRRAGDPGRRRGVARVGPAVHRGAAAVRAAVLRRAAPGVPAAHRTSRGAGHERRRDVADRSRDPVRRRPRDSADLAVQQASEGAAAADREGLAGVGQPAGRPVRPGGRRHLHPAVQRRRTSRRGRSSPSRRSCAPTWPRSSCR